MTGQENNTGNPKIKRWQMTQETQIDNIQGHRKPKGENMTDDTGIPNTYKKRQGTH